MRRGTPLNAIRLEGILQNALKEVHRTGTSFMESRSEVIGKGKQAQKAHFLSLLFSARRKHVSRDFFEIQRAENASLEQVERIKQCRSKKVWF